MWGKMTEEDTKLMSVVQVNKSQSSIRITVPKPIADEMNLKHGSFVEFYRVGEHIVIKKGEWRLLRHIRLVLLSVHSDYYLRKTRNRAAA